MVVDHVHDNSDSGVVKRLDHLLAFLYADVAVVGICGIRAFGTVIVDRVVTPVVLLHNILALVYRTEIVHRHYLNVLNAQLFEIVNAGRRSALNAVDGGSVLGEGEEFAAVRFDNAAVFGRGEICYGNFPNRRVGGFGNKNVPVVIPVVGICRAEIDYHRAFSVDSAAFCVHVAGFVLVVAVLYGVGVVHSRKVAVNADFPDACLFV